jgi:DNA-binding NarL/FixJ family response regulator
MPKRWRSREEVTDAPVEEKHSLDHLIGVVLADPAQGALAQMSELAAGQPDMEVLVTADDADLALEAMQGLPHRVGVVAVVGLGLGGEHDSFWLIRSIREIYPTLPILACGTDIDEATFSWALFTGADGFVALEVDPAMFLDALRRIARRELTLEGLPSDWMAREDDRREPMVVLPEQDVAEGGSSAASEPTLVLRNGDHDPERQDVLTATAAAEDPAAGSRIGRLFSRRRRDPSLGG